MGKFGWAKGHSREPSKDALDKLWKEHETRTGSTPDHSPKSRSRSSTLSFYDRSDGQHTLNGSEGDASLDQPEKVTRGLFGKGGRLLRRQGSKLTFGPAQVENGLITSGFFNTDEPVSLKRGPSSKSFGTRPHAPGSPTSADIKASISNPYGFHHIAGKGQFQDLNKVVNLDLVKEDPDVEAGFSFSTGLHSAAPSNLPSSTETSAASGITASFSSRATTPELPSTPPRPSPPPKDTPLSPKTPDVRVFRSLENFSRPTRSPIAPALEMTPVREEHPATSATSPVSILEAPPQSPSVWAEETFDRLAGVSVSRRQSGQILDKPLPPQPYQSPTSVVHAVSTGDQSAVPLRTAPLPELPLTPSLEKNKSSAELLPAPASSFLRHAQSFPTTKLLRRRSQSSADIPLYSSFAAPTAYTSNNAKANRISVGLKKIDIDDWEDAIDYSWDHPFDLEENLGVPVFAPTATPQMPPSRPESLVVIGQPPSHPVSQPTTPLMMQAPHKPLPIPSMPSTETSAMQSIRSSLGGLGIGHLGHIGHGPDRSIQSHRASKRESFIMPALGPAVPSIRRDPGSPLSKSSSQESIILSIASSIMGTHRSSNSSTSLGDLSALTSIEDQNESGELLTDKSKTIEVLPSTVIVAQARPSDDSNSSGNSSDCSHETIKTDIIPATPTYAPPAVPESAAPLPSERRFRSTSISRANVPDRTSSVTATLNKAPASRARSSTLTNRSRYNPGRASYSLFPTAQPPPPVTNTTPAQ